MPDNIDAIVERMTRAFLDAWLMCGNISEDIRRQQVADTWRTWVPEIKAALTASGLLDRIATLEAELTRLKYPKPLPRIIPGICSELPGENTD